MIKFLISIVAVVALSGCSTLFTQSTVTQAKAAIANPNNDAKAAQDAIAAIGVAVLHNNPTYAANFIAAGDALTAAATASSGVLTSADVQAIFSKTHLSTADQNDIVSAFNLSQSTLLSDFGVQLPQFQQIYALWLQAVANGFYIPAGHAAVTLPVIPWPPVTTSPAASASAVSAKPASAAN